ncbi:MAG: RcnB family protein [Sphingomicrobium sp.]
MAGAMVPAAAMAQDQDQEGDRRAKRAEHRAERTERSSASDDRPQPQERAVRIERPERPQIERIQNVAREPRFERRERQVEQVQQVEQVRQAPTQQVQVYQQRGVLGAIRETARQQQTLEARPATRDGYRDHRSGSHGDYHRDLRQDHGDLHASDPNRRGHRNWHRDAERQHDRRHSAWTTDWRRDSQYNWYDYRSRYGSLYNLGRYYDPYGWGYRRFSIGFSIGSGYYGSNYWLDDPWMYRLPPAYGPYRWIRYYDDALLVNIYSGQVVDVIHNFFW